MGEEREPKERGKRLVLAHLYPGEMNVYGDRGNIICLTQRCRWRGIDLDVMPVELGQDMDPSVIDIIFMGGGQDREQQVVAEDLLKKGAAIREAIESGASALLVCGGYQLFSRYYRPAEGPDLPGIGIFDAWTIHKGHNVARCIGNVVAEWEGGRIVGFENHGGRTYLGTARPLAKVISGFGNNAEDGYEGVQYRNAYGTYLHGPILPKNPALCDHLIRTALERRYPGETLPDLDDSLEQAAHSHAEARAFQQNRKTGPLGFLSRLRL